ncbi:MAG TPA: peptide chain release factor N(5)-glutamine methyltransferase, partial [Candidatus Limnocylindria bacterium]
MPAAVLPQASAGRLVADTARSLQASGIPSPRLDAELLVGHAFGRDRAWLHAHPDAELGPGEARLLAGWVERR